MKESALIIILLFSMLLTFSSCDGSCEAEKDDSLQKITGKILYVGEVFGENAGKFCFLLESGGLVTAFTEYWVYASTYVMVKAYLNKAVANDENITLFGRYVNSQINYTKFKNNPVLNIHKIRFKSEIEFRIR